MAQSSRIQALQDFRVSLTGYVSQPGDETYAIDKWNVQAIQKAQYVVTALSAEDISASIKFARTNGIPFAVRSGGHNTQFSSSTEGLLIDLRKMNNIRVDAEKRVAHIQPGVLSGQVNAELPKYGLAGIAGVCSLVGMGGYITGGGMGTLMGLHGMAIDNLLSATVVLANGDIVEASEKENPDLFWGIRGGGSNFGIISEFRMRVHEAPKEIYSITYIYGRHQLQTVTEAIEAWLPNQTPSDGALFGIVPGPDGNIIVVVQGWHLNGVEAGEKAFKPLKDIGPVFIANDGEVPLDHLSHYLDSVNDPHGNIVFTGNYITKFDWETVKRATEAQSELHKRAPVSPLLFEFYHYDKKQSVPNTATAYAQRHKGWKVVLTGVGWTDETFTPFAVDQLEVFRKAVSAGEDEPLRESLGYPNYADIFSWDHSTDKAARKVFGENYPRLQEIKKKYDSEGIFNKWFSIKP